jgi:hypothetical protein
MPVGLFAGQGCIERPVQLADDDLLSSARAAWSKSRTKRARCSAPSSSNRSLARSSRSERTRAARAHRGTGASIRVAAEPFDDVTIMALRLGVPAEAFSTPSPTSLPAA